MLSLVVAYGIGGSALCAYLGWIAAQQRRLRHRLKVAEAAAARPDAAPARAKAA